MDHTTVTLTMSLTTTMSILRIVTALMLYATVAMLCGAVVLMPRKAPTTITVTRKMRRGRVVGRIAPAGLVRRVTMPATAHMPSVETFAAR